MPCWSHDIFGWEVILCPVVLVTLAVGVQEGILDIYRYLHFVFQLFGKFKHCFRRHRARKGWKECPCQVRGQWGQWRNKGKYLQKIKQKSFTSFTFQLPKVIEGKSLLLEDNTHRHFPGLLPMLLVEKKKIWSGGNQPPKWPGKLLLHYSQWPIFACSRKCQRHPKVF